MHKSCRWLKIELDDEERESYGVGRGVGAATAWETRDFWSSALAGAFAEAAAESYRKQRRDALIAAMDAKDCPL